MSRRVRQWIGFLIMLAGLGLLSSPFLIGAYQESEQQTVVEDFYRLREEIPAVPTETAEPESTRQEPEPENPIKAFYHVAEEYNDSLRHGGQDAMNSLADLETFPLDGAALGCPNNVIGTLRIPRLEVELGLYLGANTENMAKGAAVFGMTSIPLGQPGENVSIAGHRGWNGTPMFRDIQRIQNGDPVYITTAWGELEYRVSGIEIVSPDNLNWCRIRPDRTLITLMTCHPYGQNYQRYIVYADLVTGEEPETVPVNEDDAAPELTPVVLVHDDGTREMTLVDSTAIDPDGREYGAVLSNIVIMAENKMRPVAYVMAVLVALVGIWLTVQTVRDVRREKGEKNHGSE